LHEIGVDELRFGGNDGQRFVTILSLKKGSPLRLLFGRPDIRPNDTQYDDIMGFIAVLS
jgi:hypothetical protein